MIKDEQRNSTQYFTINKIKYDYFKEFRQSPHTVLLLKESKNSIKTVNSNFFNYWKESVSLLDYCLNLGIYVPHFCYHKQLSISGNCRMCLVELVKSPKPVVSCAMNARSTLSANTEIFTNSPLVKKSRENILEFLLLNHPLDCPICDQGGECDLQDQSFFFGLTKKRFYSYKRIVSDKNLGLIVKTVMTRCIHCTRCVRFASEIAGVEDLGIFGRGIHSEIGTYVNKIFQSELSGNIVDLCPVGALTLKPYPFLGRNWELKKIVTIDPSDGYGSNIQVFLKNNKIIKVLSSFDNFSTDNPNLWISDKTRFLFDSTFSSNRNVSKFIMSQASEVKELLWKNIFDKLVKMIYLFDHLQKHTKQINMFIIMFDENSSLEVISILLLLKKKYTIFDIRKTINTKLLNDFQSDFKINALRNTYLLASSNACLLLGTNTRYESPYFNLKLKKRYSIGNFRVFSISSFTNMTFPSINIGANLQKIESIVEGNNNTGLDITKSKNLLAVLNTEILLRQDSFGLISLLQSLNDLGAEKIWNIFNLLNNSLNSVGINSLHSFKSICKNDLSKSHGLFFINNGLRASVVLTKFLELLFLNYFLPTVTQKFLIEQNYKNLFLNLSDELNIYDYMYLPNNTFFENSDSYINTEGNLKFTTKLISSTYDTKDDWKILRKIMSDLKTIQFTNSTKNNIKIYYNSISLYNFKNFISFLFLNTQTLSKFSFYKQTFNQTFKYIKTRKSKKLKILRTQIKKWIEDFYLGGFDNYSSESKTMILSSLAFRELTNTFSK